jgi:hypothetical protein
MIEEIQEGEGGRRTRVIRDRRGGIRDDRKRQYTVGIRILTFK